MKNRNLLFLLLLISGAGQAYDFGGGEIQIPDGFEGSITQNMGKELVPRRIVSLIPTLEEHCFK